MNGCLVLPNSSLGRCCIVTSIKSSLKNRLVNSHYPGIKIMARGSITMVCPNRARSALAFISMRWVNLNGPIIYIPGSHTHGLIDYEVIEVPGTTPIPSLPDATVSELVEEGGMVAPKGPPGSVTIFDSCMAHASGQNLSP